MIGRATKTTRVHVRSVVLAALALVPAAACGSRSDGIVQSNYAGVDDGGTGANGDGSVDPGDDAGPPPSFPPDAVSILVEPNGNKGSELRAEIYAAKSSVYMTMYTISDDTIIGAITNRQAAGLDVKIVLDGSSQNKSFNQPAFDSFNAVVAGSAVWSSSAFAYTHQKTVIIDGAQAWIMTMNLTRGAPLYYREYLAVDTVPADIAEATAIFQADFVHAPITPVGDLVVSDSNARAKLVALIGTATTSLDLELEELTDMTSGGIVASLVARANAGVKVRVVVADNDAATPAAVSAVKSAGGSVITFGADLGNATSSNPYVAGKTILVDCSTGACARGYVGSENMTANSLDNNRELGVILSNATELGKIYATVDADAKAGTPR